MEVDPVELQDDYELDNGTRASTTATGSRSNEIVVDDNHPFDLDVYITSYNGMCAIGLLNLMLLIYENF